MRVKQQAISSNWVEISSKRAPVLARTNNPYIMITPWVNSSAHLSLLRDGAWVELHIISAQDQTLVLWLVCTSTQGLVIEYIRRFDTSMVSNVTWTLRFEPQYPNIIRISPFRGFKWNSSTSCILFLKHNSPSIHISPPTLRCMALRTALTRSTFNSISLSQFCLPLRNELVP